MKSDYLKYWRVVNQYVKVRYKLSQGELDMLLFLYSEKYFKVTKFKEFEELMPWDKHRFFRMVKDGWIENFRPGVRGVRAVYKLSFKAMRLVNSIYKKLDGEEIPETMCNNPMFKKKVRYTDKVYRNFIIEMNKANKEARLTKQLPHHAPEL